MRVEPSVSGVRLVAAAAFLLAACGAAGDDVDPNGSSASCVEPSPEPGDGQVSILAGSSPMRSPEAPTPAQVRFAADGTILVVDQTRPEVVEAPRSLDDSVFTEATLDPDSAGYELTWSRGSGELRLLRFEGGR